MKAFFSKRKPNSSPKKNLSPAKNQQQITQFYSSPSKMKKLEEKAEVVKQKEEAATIKSQHEPQNSDLQQVEKRTEDSMKPSLQQPTQMSEGVSKAAESEVEMKENESPKATTEVAEEPANSEPAAEEVDEEALKPAEEEPAKKASQEATVDEAAGASSQAEEEAQEEQASSPEEEAPENEMAGEVELENMNPLEQVLSQAELENLPTRKGKAPQGEEPNLEFEKAAESQDQEEEGDDDLSLGSDDLEQIVSESGDQEAAAAEEPETSKKSQLEDPENGQSEATAKEPSHQMEDEEVPEVDDAVEEQQEEGSDEEEAYEIAQKEPSAEASKPQAEEEEAIEEVNDEPVDEEPAEAEDEEEVEELEIDDEFDEENLELLCDAVENEKRKNERAKELQSMKNKMSARLKAFDEQKAAAKVQKMEDDANQSKEPFSGLIFRENTRVMEDDEVAATAHGRKFFGIETLDSPQTRLTLQQTGQTSGAFTIGVLVNKSSILTSKAGKKFSFFKLSDLAKYDVNAVERVASSNLEKSDVKLVMKSYTGEGYKQITFMSFGEDASKEIMTLRTGTIVGLLNPRVMSNSNPEHGYAFSIDTKAQIFVIGYSQDYDICKGKSQSSQILGSQFKDQFGCQAFLNKSIETLCDKHKHEKKMANLNRVKAGRLNTMGTRVDINAIRRFQKMEDTEARIGAFGGGRTLARNVNKPAPLLSPKRQSQVNQRKELGQKNLTTYFEQRAMRFDHTNKLAPQGRIKTTEGAFVHKSQYEDMGLKAPKQQDLGKKQVMAPSNDDDDDFEIDFGGAPKAATNAPSGSFLARLQESKKKQSFSQMQARSYATSNSASVASQMMKKRKLN